jgi:hypothetical protein
MAGADAMIASRAIGHKSSRLSGTIHGGWHIISCEQLADAPGSPQSPDLHKSLEESELGPDAPLLPPPAFNLNSSHGLWKSLLPSEQSMTPGNDPELVMLYMAQHVIASLPHRPRMGQHHARYSTPSSLIFQARW